MKTKSEIYHDRTARQYDRTYQTPYWRLYHEVTWHNIERFLPKADGSFILDAGGGTGYWAIKLAELGYRVALTDISARMLEVAKRKIAKESLQVLKDGRYAREFPMKWFTPDELKDLFQANGLEVVRMISKTVLPYKVNPRILRSDRNFRKLLELELRLCDEPCLLGRAGHLEIVGKKRKGGRDG